MLFEAIPFETLSSAQVLESSGITPVARDGLSIGSSRVRVGQVSRVLYVPDLRLQLMIGDCVPEESLVDGWDLAFEVRRDFQGRATTYRSPFEAEESDEEVAVLSNFWSSNFGHWTTDELVKVHILERYGYRGKYVIHGLPTFAEDYLAMLGVAPDRLIKSVAHPTVYRSAWYTTVIYEAKARRYADIYLSLRDVLVRASLPPTVQHSERIWMSRESQVNNGRPVINTAEVRQLVDKYGFETLDMASLPVPHQVHVSSRTRVLAGGHGAGFAHALFMEMHGSIIECFSPTYINPSVFGLCHVMDHQYSMIVYGNHFDGYPNEGGVLVDLNHLELVLRHL